MLTVPRSPSAPQVDSPLPSESTMMMAAAQMHKLGRLRTEERVKAPGQNFQRGPQDPVEPSNVPAGIRGENVVPMKAVG